MSIIIGRLLFTIDGSIVSKIAATDKSIRVLGSVVTHGRIGRSELQVDGLGKVFALSRPKRRDIVEEPYYERRFHSNQAIAAGMHVA